MVLHNSPWLKPIPFVMVRYLLLAGLCLLAGARPALAAREPAASGDGWPEVTAEERGLTRLPQDPEADAVILMNERQGKIVKHGDDWVNSMTYHWRLKVLSDKGKEHGEVRIRASKGSRVSNVQARTIKADGTIVPVASDQIFEKVVEQIGSFKRTEWVFNFPAVDVGAILEYRYERNDNYFVYLDPWYFEGEAYTLRSRVAQAIPGGMGYAVLCDLCPGDVKPTITDWRDAKERGQLYSMELRDLPGYREEGLMPPRREVSPHMEMVLQTWKNFMDPALGRQDRFFIDWDSVARYAGYYYDRVIKEGQAALKPIVDGWIQGMADPDQKVKGIVRHVEDDFRYIHFVNVGGSARPIASILKEKNADNEEKAVLLIAALKTAGIEARPALVVGKDYGSLNPKFFSFSQFTHTVAALPRPDGSYQWLDPTVSYAPFG